MTTKQLLDAVEHLDKSSIEKNAFNYLIEEEYEDLPFQGHEGDRLRSLCIEILIERLDR